MTPICHYTWIVILGAILVQERVQIFAADPANQPVSKSISTNIHGPAGPDESKSKADAVAGQFAIMCAGCHSLAGIKLNGPDLSSVATWPTDQLKAAIKRMEKNVGLLSDEQVSSLAELLKAPNVRERIKAEQERIQSQFMAKMAPPDPQMGKALFLGKETLLNGGLACVACHSAAGIGGNLGVDLSGVFSRLGGMTPLVSAIEQASFKIMAPHYKRHPITKQEAMHLAKYLSTIDPNKPAPNEASLLPVSCGAAIFMLAGLIHSLRIQRKRRGRDTKLQRHRK